MLRARLQAPHSKGAARETEARGTPRLGGLDSEGRRGRWPQVTSWNLQARPPSPPAAGLREPPPRDRARPPRAACFHDNRTSLARAARETPRVRAQPPRRAPPAPGPRRPANLRDPESRTPRSDPSRRFSRTPHSPPTQPAAAAFPRGSYPRRWPEPVSRTRAWRDASCRPPNGRGGPSGAGQGGRGLEGRGRRREDGSASSSCGQPETRSGPREGAGLPRDELLAQWTPVRPEGGGGGPPFLRE